MEEVILSRPRSNAQQLKAIVHLATFVGQFTQLRRNGSQFRGLCPLHSERRPSFYVHPVKQIFYCFGCQQGGDVFSFIRALRRCSFPEAIAELQTFITSGFVATDRAKRGREHCPPKAGRRPKGRRAQR